MSGMRILLASLALLTIAATDAPFEPRPITDAEKDVIRQAVRKKLTDPDSAQFRWNPEVLDGITYCGFVNSKNRLGGYVGHAPFMVFFTSRENRTVYSTDIGASDITERVMLRMCGDRGYNLDPANLATIDD